AEAEAEAEAEAPAASPDPSSAETVVKPSATLAGEDELAARKGSWSYQAEGDTPQPDSGADTGAGDTGETDAPAQAPASAPEAGDTTAVDYDKDGVVEGTQEGEKPQQLSEAREGGADNLKEIKGVGPKLESLLNEMGFYHFDQIAAWTDQEVAWVNANLKGFKGRVSRDNWVEQAKILAAGGETEFSQRVEDGKVY
ncbi:MAG: fused NADH-quinone oxidoreductase subunit E/endonuclease, partial [Pelagimonas sp.]|nr:fused NADH-quinone oxidoreductase subunit E/endonuclease [Pelagimonas sp.]